MWNLCFVLTSYCRDKEELLSLNYHLRIAKSGCLVDLDGFVIERRHGLEWTVDYLQSANIRPPQVSNQDRLTPHVWLTRASSKGLFNAFYETSAGTLSPSNTEWA